MCNIQLWLKSEDRDYKRGQSIGTTVSSIRHVSIGGEKMRLDREEVVFYRMNVRVKTRDVAPYELPFSCILDFEEKYAKL